MVRHTTACGIFSRHNYRRADCSRFRKLARLEERWVPHCDRYTGAMHTQ